MTSVAERLQKKSSRRPATKQVRLKLVYIDFWSALKLSFFVALALGIVMVVATMLIWIVLNSTGILGQLDTLLGDIFGGQAFTLAEDFSFQRVMTFGLVIAALNTIVLTVLGGLSAVLYNFIVKMTGGLHVGFTNS